MMIQASCWQADSNFVVSDGSEELPDGRSDLHHAAGELYVNVIIVLNLINKNIINNKCYYSF